MLRRAVGRTLEKETPIVETARDEKSIELVVHKREATRTHKTNKKNSLACTRQYMPHGDGIFSIFGHILVLMLRDTARADKCNALKPKEHVHARLVCCGDGL